MKRIFVSFLLLSLCVAASAQPAQRGRIRDFGIEPGVFKPGTYNAITDVPGVRVGHVTIIEGDNIRTGVTAIVPHDGNVFRKKCPAAIYVGNGFGKLAGVTQVRELGNIETPIILTNTLSVAQGIEGVLTYTMGQKGNEEVRSVNAVVGETNDSYLNDIRGRHVKADDVVKAILSAKGGPVEEGCVGAGVGTICFSWKGGIGTSSRVLPANLGGYTVGVLVQTNYGGILEIEGAPVGRRLGQYSFRSSVEDHEYQMSPDGSCMMVVFTDAPLDARNLERMAKRAMMGLAKTGGIASNGSGDYVIAVSVNPENLIDESTQRYYPTLLHNDDMSPLFEATIEATAEALWNSLFMATDMKGRDGHFIPALPIESVLEILRQPR
jgi:D-aminopeptidase